MARTKMKSSIVDNVLEFDYDKIRAREAEVARETDADIIARLRERFDILTEMTKAVKSGDVRAMIDDRKRLSAELSLARRKIYQMEYGLRVAQKSLNTALTLEIENDN